MVATVRIAAAAHRSIRRDRIFVHIAKDRTYAARKCQNTITLTLHWRQKQNEAFYAVLKNRRNRYAISSKHGIHKR